MRIPSHLRSGEVGFNMTPMIDVVFLLIIFFLVSSHLAQQESRLPLELPSAKSGDKPLDDESPRVVINVTDDGQIVMAGHPVAADQLGQRLRQRKQQQGNDQLEIRLRGDRRLPYRVIKPILLACVENEVSNVTLTVLAE